MTKEELENAKSELLTLMGEAVWNKLVQVHNELQRIASKEALCQKEKEQSQNMK